MKRIGVATAAIAAIALACGLSACGSSGGQSAQSGSAKGGEKTEITVWAWDGQFDKAIEGFEAANPDIKVKLENVGSSMDEYKALDNAIQAGSGVPDAVMFEYFSVPYFAIPGKLADLNQFGAQELKDDFVEGAWNNVDIGGATYALPTDYGPSVMFYNEAVFEEAGVSEPPETWEEYYEAAKKIHALGDDYYIANDNGDLFLLLSMIWQGGGRPFVVDGNNVEIDFNGPESQQAIEYWEKLINEGLVTTEIGTWSDEWNRALNEGKIASQVIGGWLTSSLPERAPDAAGDFRVAMMPQWSAGENVGAENGGSSLGIPEAAPNKEAAYKFIEYVSHGDGLQARVDAGVLVPNRSVLDSEEFVSATNPFFGDQKYNEVLAQAAAAVPTGWQYPPFFEWARTSWADYAIPFYANHTGSLNDVIEAWTQGMVDYGNQQGFTVK